MSTTNSVRAKQRVLVVEDDPVAKLLAKTWFVAYGVRVDFADSYPQVRHLMAEHAYQLIIMDIGLPCGDSGIDITEKLKADWRTANVPIVGITSRTSQHLHMQALKSGMAACYVKPLSRHVFQRVCRDYLSEQEEVAGTDAWATA